MDDARVDDLAAQLHGGARLRAGDRLLLGRRGGDRTSLPSRAAAVAGRRSWAWRISDAHPLYSSASALSSFSALLYAFWLKPASDWPWVQRRMIVSPMSAVPRRDRERAPPGRGQQQHGWAAERSRVGSGGG